MRARNSKAVTDWRIRLAGIVLVGILFNGCTGNNLPKFGAFRKKEAEEETPMEKMLAESQSPSHLKWATSYNQAIQTAGREGKLLMAHFTGSDWCTWCVKLDEEVFDTPEFEQWADANVVPLKLDFPRSTKLPREQLAHNQQILAKYQSHVKGYPTILFLDPQGNVIAKMGYAKGGPQGWISKAESKLQ